MVSSCLFAGDDVPDSNIQDFALKGILCDVAVCWFMFAASS